MEQFKKMLFVSCGEKEDLAALDRAHRLALDNNARLTLVRVIDELPAALGYFLPKKRLNALQEAAETLAGKELEQLAGKFDASLQVETRILTGKPFLELIRAVLANSHDLLIKPKQSPTEDAELDSTELHLLRKCPCPVWFIKPSQRKPFGKILIAVDPDPSDAERLNLHTELLKLGASLANSENGKIEVVHVWEMYGAKSLDGPRYNLTDDEISAMEDKLEKTHRKWLDDLVAPYADLPLKATLVKGSTSEALLKLIEKRKPDIVIMGTLARSGLPGFLIGNTAETVLSKISSSIFTIKPRGFKTPVS